MKSEVLIAEREANMQACLSFLMARAGFRVRTVKDGAEVLAAFEDAPPDVVLLAVDLDKYDGYELCRLLRADERWSGVKIAMVTARARLVERDKAMALGADEYITKPFANSDLLAAVRGLMAGTGR